MSAQKPVELLPCPFCGKAGPFDECPCDYIDGTGASVVRCPWCHGAAPISKWNCRAAPEAASCARERMESAISLDALAFGKGWSQGASTRGEFSAVRGGAK